MHTRGRKAGNHCDHEGPGAVTGSPGRDSTTRRTEEQILDLFAALPDPAARDELVHEFMSLARYFAGRFVGRGQQLEDLVQVANIGLLNAVDRFDPERGVQFSTFAAATIVGELKRFFRDKGWGVRVPRHLQEHGMLVSRAVEELSQRLGRSPTPKEVATKAGISEGEVLDAMDAATAYTLQSLDEPLGDAANPTALADTIGEVDPGFEFAEAWRSVLPVIEKLPERDRWILYLRFFDGLTQTQIAEEVGISQMHVSRLLTKTIERLKEAVGD
jgi:RNA polymerase sigma-B factor